MDMIQKYLGNLGFGSLNEMQKNAAEAWREEGDIILLSPTGTGKTLAYLLPLVGSLNPASGWPSALVIVPGRELAQQSAEVMRRMKTPLRCMSVTGGRPTMEEHRKIRVVRPDVIFATPGRLLDHLQKGNIDLSAVSCVVTDEYDKCAELGFKDEIASIFRLIPPQARRVVTSATDSGSAGLLVGGNFRTIDCRPQEEHSGTIGTSCRINTFSVVSPEKDKLETLARLLSHIGSRQTIVFVSHRESVDRVVRYLKKEKFSAEAYHGGMEQDRRERALYKFRAGCAQVLVATDLAARGIDIPEVQAVVEYHLPSDLTTHMHRAGRTARWDAQGDVFLIIGPEESIPDFIASQDSIDVSQTALCPTLPRMAALYIGKGKRSKLSKGDVLGFLCKIGGLSAEDIGRIEIHADHSFAGVGRQRLNALLARVAGEKIKGVKTRIEPMRG